MAKNKKNKSKKFPKNVSGSLPYFLISSTGEIREFGLGGDLGLTEEQLGTMQTAAVNAPVIANKATDALGLNNNIAEDRSANKNKAVVGGVIEGAASGFSTGMQVGGPIGGAIGAVAGGIGGGVMAGKNKDAEIKAFGESMDAKYANYDPGTTQYYGALGGELPEMYNLGGDLTDPPSKNGTSDLVDNPYYKEQLKAYQESLTNAPQASLSATADQAFIDNFVQRRKKTMPDDYQKFPKVNKLVYDPNSVDPVTGTPNAFLEYYDKPSAQIQKPKIAQAAPTNEAPDSKIAYLYRHGQYQNAHGKDIPREESPYGTQASMPELDTSTLNNTTSVPSGESLSIKDQLAAERTAFLEANNAGRPMRADGGPIGQELGMGGEATEYNGNSHETGGIKVGNAEVEDGEIRVGDYIFSDRLTTEKGKTFADAAKKITKQFEEYENDGPSMRTQNKQLEELKFQNDQARLLKQKEDAEMQMMMAEDHRAYGGMIEKDSRGKYQVDKSNRVELLNAAKNRKMSYNKYLDSLYAYGGELKKYDGGGKYDPRVREYENPGGPINEVGDLPVRGLDTLELNPLGDNYNPELAAAPELSYTPSTYEEPQEGRFGNEEKALLTSMLPNLGNLATANRRGNTRFDRVNLDEVNLDNERRQIRQSIDRARNTQRENVRGTATSSGDALAALSAGNAGLTNAEMNAMLGVGEREANTNIQIRNQEDMTNVGIANQEIIARQQDDAMRDSVKDLALSGMATNYQGYLKDKGLSKENDAANKRLLSLLDTGEYEIVEDGEGGYKVSYKAKKKPTTKTER